MLQNINILLLCSFDNISMQNESVSYIAIKHCLMEMIWFAFFIPSLGE